MKRTWLKRILIGVGVCLALLPCIVPCIIGLWMYWGFFGDDILFQLHLPVFPGAQEVASDSVYNSTQSALNVVYYWTDKPLENVRAYYEELSSANEYQLEFLVYEGLHIRPRGCFHWPTQPPDCIEVMILDFVQSETIYLPDVHFLNNQFVTPNPTLLEKFSGGTLIIYGYYTPEL